MSKENPFLKTGINNERGFTKYIKNKCDNLCIGESDSIELEGLKNKSIKAILSTNYNGKFITRQHQGITWIKRIKND